MKSHAALAEHFATMAAAHKACFDAEEEGSHGRTFHKAAMQSCLKAGEHFVAAAKISKAAGMTDDNELEKLPTGLSFLLADNPTVRAIPRAGSAPIQKSDFNADLAELFKVEGN